MAYLVRSLLAITKRTLLDRPLTPGQGNGSSSWRRNFEFNHILWLWQHCQRSFDRTWFVPFCISTRICFFLPATTLELGLSRSIPTQFDASLRHNMISTGLHYQIKKLDLIEMSCMCESRLPKLGDPIKDGKPDIFKTDWLVNKFPSVYFETLLDETPSGKIRMHCAVILDWALLYNIRAASRIMSLNALSMCKRPLLW